MTTVYRQGDIILERIDKLPGGVDFDGFELSLTGETGNAHVLPGKVYSRGGSLLQQFIEVGQGGAVMVHPEHPGMVVPAGIYNVRRVRTYAPDRPMDAVD